MRILVVDDDPEIVSFLKRGLIYEGYAVDTAYDEGGALRGWLKVNLKDGREYEKTTEAFRGSPLNPLTEKDVIKKFMNNATMVITEEKADIIIERIKSLEETANISDIMNACKV